MKKLQIVLAAVIITASWFLAMDLIAQVPQKMSYQAIIRNSSNALITNSSIGVKTSILQGSATGTLIYEEVYNPVPETNDNGLVTIGIGSGIAMTGIFADIDWANGPYYIQTDIDPDGGTTYTITSTSELLGVPFALYADRAEYGEDEDADPVNEIQTISQSGDIITLSNGGGTVIDNTEDADADPVNEIQTISESGNTITLSNGGGSVTDNIEDADADPVNEIQNLSISGVDLSLSSANSVTLPICWNQSAGNVYLNNGFVGIGTDNPTSNLHVYNAINSTNFLLESGNFTTFQLKSLTSDYSLYGDDYSGSLKLRNNNTSNYNLVVANNGNVGIGHYIPPATPLYNFEVLGDINYTGSLYHNGSLLAEGLWIDDGTNIYYNGGNVGIGTTTPSYPLQATGTGSNTAFFYNNGTLDGAETVISYMDDDGSDFTSSAFYGRSYSDNGFGVAGHNYWYGVGVGAWSYGGNLIEAYDGDYSGGNLEFYIDQSGNTWTNGSFNGFKSIEAKDGATHVAMKSIQSPEAWFEDFGSASLINGQAVVEIDELFTQVASTSTKYLVFLTAVSENAVHLFVSKKAADSFTVKGVNLDGSPANCSFDYRIVANDAEDKGQRFETVDIPEEVVVPRDLD